MQMPKNAKKAVYKEKEFKSYVLWKSMPAYFRGMKKEQLESHGFTDALLIKIATIKSQTAFAKAFHIKDLGTLTDWNNKIEKENLYINDFKNLINEQISSVNNKITSKPNTLLENKIREQRKLINFLKIENRLFKSQLNSFTRKSSKIVKTDSLPAEQIITPPIATEKPFSFFQKVKNTISSIMTGQ